MTQSTEHHEHEFMCADRDENADRIRTKSYCICGVVRFGCFAKRTGAGGQEWWGPVGTWTYSYNDPR